MAEKKNRLISPMRFRERVEAMLNPEKGLRKYHERLEAEKKERVKETIDELRKTASASGYHYHGASKTKNSLI